MKFRVISPEHSEQIQTELFRLGITESEVINTNYKFILADLTYGFLYFSNDEEEFNKEMIATETTLEQLRNM